MRTFTLPKTGFPFNITHEKLNGEYFEHDHDFFEMVTVISGTARHIVNGVEIALRAGDIFIINRENTHGFRAAEALEFYNLVFIPEMLSQYAPELRRIPGFHTLFVTGPALTDSPAAPFSLHLAPADLLRAADLLEGMLRDLTEKADGFEALIRAKLILLAGFVARRYTEAAAAAGSVLPDEQADLMRLARAVSYMEKDFTQKIPLAHLAEISHLSVRQFTRLFRSFYGTSPTEYIIALRVRLAAELLKRRDSSVTEVALQSGFYDSSVFSRYFKKLTGQTPSEYRAGNM